MSAVVAQSHFIFGLRSGVRNNLCFYDEHTVVFPSGNTCVCYNTAQRCQRFIPGSETSQGMRALAISANRRYLAVSECGERATVTVFDLHHEQGRKRKVLTAGDALAGEFVSVAFSPDSKYMIGQTGGPQWMLIFWLWEKQKILATVKTSEPNNSVTQVSFSPHSNTQVCVSGRGVFKLLRYSEGFLKQCGHPKVESVDILCHTWASGERAIAGTDKGRLLVFESGELRGEINVTSTAAQGQSDRQAEMKKIRGNDVGEGPRITAILSYSKGFACSLGPGTVCLFEKTQLDGYRRSREIRIPSDPRTNELTPAECQEIDTMCISPAEGTLAISTDRRQLYSFSLSSVEIHKEEHFQFLLQSFHSKSITGLSVCVRKPLVATSSLDHSVRIWNYETKLLELYKEFQEAAHSVALHPTGLFILVGFSDKLRLMNLLIDDIRTIKEFTLRGCTECAFSHGGHVFAAVSGNIIHIYSVTSFENIRNLKAHNAKVRGIEWSLNDTRLVSCGMDGAVYEWNTQTGKRESESVLKSCSYTDVAFSSDFQTILAVGTDLTLKEIQDCQVLKEVPADEVAHTTVAVSHSGRVIFTGTSSGTVRAIKYPLSLEKEWIMYQAHCGPVTKMVITFDEQFLLTTSEDGCLMMWKVIDKEGQELKSNRQIIYSEEILVTKSDLEEKNQNMLELTTRLEELQMENEYQLRLKDMNYNEKMKEISDKFIQQIESLKTMQQAMKTEMERQAREHQESSAEAAVKHSKELKGLELSSSQKLIVEHKRHQDLQHKYQKMQEDYEKQLRAMEERKVQSLEELTQLSEAKLQEKSRLLVQCEEEARQQVREFKEFTRQVENDEERLTHDIRVQYEKQLHTERQINTNLKGESDLMKQKLYGLQRRMDDRSTDIDKLKQERQRLLGLIHSLESDIEDLKRQISGHESNNQDKDQTICNLKKKNQELEKLKFILDFQLSELNNKAKTQEDDINEKKQQLHQLEEELVQIDKSNTQLKVTISDMGLKLRTKDKEMHKERLIAQDTETHLQRLKSDLHDCVGFIQEPRKLKESVQTIYARYVSQADVVKKSSVDEDIQKAFTRQRDYQEKIVNSLKARLARAAAEHEKVNMKMMKEKETLFTKNNELRKELNLARARVKNHVDQLAVLKKSQMSDRAAKKGPEFEGDN
ncbi:cilia- and flagella-associated protein 57 [Clinocottus analis]|uniref:cilia- and flagella-associated protein 57 n=1 Tax=Clinocottus analis TaxID=304258 RepID=UPI0035C0B336